LKFKIDENLPVECASGLRDAGYDAETVGSEKLSGANDSQLFERCQAESRKLVTLDLDFANVHAYPPGSSAGIVVLRPRVQDIRTILSLLRRVIAVMAEKPPQKQLWIVEPGRIRYRED
jgi:predicted nuclease of predicted toxin-antitoxin system